MELGWGWGWWQGLCSTSDLPPAPQLQLLGASPALKNISHSREFNGHSEQRGQRDPQDKVRGAARLRGGTGQGQGDANTVPPHHRRGSSSRSHRGRASVAGCPPAMELRGGGTLLPGDPSLHPTCW